MPQKMQQTPKTPQEGIVTQNGLHPLSRSLSFFLSLVIPKPDRLNWPFVPL